MTQIDTAEIRTSNDVGNVTRPAKLLNAIAYEMDRLRAERIELRGAIIQTLPWLKDPIPGDVARYCLWALKQDTTPSPLQGELISLRQQLVEKELDIKGAVRQIRFRDKEIEAANKRIAELEKETNNWPIEYPDEPVER